MKDVKHKVVRVNMPVKHWTNLLDIFEAGVCRVT